MIWRRSARPNSKSDDAGATRTRNRVRSFLDTLFPLTTHFQRPFTYCEEKAALSRLLAIAICLLGAIVFAANARAAGVAAQQNAIGAPSDDQLLLAPVVDGEKVPVQVALHILNLADIDEVSQRFRVVAYLFAKWKDPRLAFTPKAGWEKFRVYRPDDVWTPHFDFVNGVAPHSAFDVTLRAFPDGTVRYYERSSAELSNTFHLHRFPFDQERLRILIHPPISEAAVVNLLQTTEEPPITIEERIYSSLAQWKIVNVQAGASPIVAINKEKTTQIEFDIDVDRESNFYIWKVFIPLLLMVVLSWTVFWIDNSELNSQVTISVTTILTVIAFAFAISTNLPKVSYLTFIDVFFLTCYVFVFVTAVELTFVHLAGRSKHDTMGRTIRRYSRIVLPIMFVVTNLVMIALYFG